MRNRLTLKNIINFVEAIDNNNKTNTPDVVDTKIYEFKFPKNISDIFEDLNISKKNISVTNINFSGKIETEPYLTFFQSIFYCVDNNFINNEIKFQKEYISNFIDELKSFLTKNYNDNKLSKREIFDMSLLVPPINPLLIKYIGIYLKINIFILDILTDKIYIYNNGLIFDYKNIFLAITDTNYEPIIFENKTSFILDSSIMQKIVNNLKKINYIDPQLKPDIFNTQQKKCNNYKEDNSEEDKLSKMSYDELKQLAKKNKIILTIIKDNKRIYKDKISLYTELKNKL